MSEESFCKFLFGLLIAAFIGALLASQCFGQEFDGVCRLSTPNGKQWSGVALSRTEILTVAHHGETGEVRAEFPEGSHEAFNRLGVKAKVIKTDVKKDLCLLGYELPEWATVKAYPIAAERGKGTVRGFIAADPYWSPIETVERGVIGDGYFLVSFKAARLEHLRTVSGMSGSPILTDKGVRGIQTIEDQSKKEFGAVSIETINLFLED